MKIDRLVAIIILLINNEKVTAKELSERFEVSVRTIQRDMDNLSMAGVPIYADVGKNGGYRLVEDYRLDRNFLSTSEASILMTFLKSIQEAVPYQETKNIANKFEMLLPKSNDEKIIFNMNPMLSDQRHKNIVSELVNAREQMKKVRISYVDAKFKQTERIIAPYRLMLLGSIWYVYAYCDDRNDFRQFKITRIQSCEMLDETFELKQIPETVPWKFNTMPIRESTTLILELDACLKGNIPEYFDYKSCKVMEDKIIVTVQFPVDEWLYSLLLSLVPHVKVIEPQWVKEEMIVRMLKGIEKMTE